MTKTMMPERGRGGEAAGGRWRGGDGVEIPATIAAKNHASRLQVLDRKNPERQIQWNMNCRE